MSLIHSRLSSNVLLALLTASLVLSGKTHAQSGTRPFQMSLVECCGSRTPTRAETDIRSFEYGAAQPAGGPSILFGVGYSSSLTSGSGVSNWSQIVAVEVDEPYTSVDDDLFLFNFFCLSPPTREIAPIDAALAKMAAELNGLNPKARFWVNFTSKEASYMQQCSEAQAFNRTYIDVISYDAYWHPLSSATYNYIAANPAKPSQQLALIPGVFTNPSYQTSQLPYLAGYFNYANAANQTCRLPLGSQGVTGNYDGCPVWIVMGWMTGDFPGYDGILDGRSDTQPILAAWQAEVALNPVTPTMQKRAKILPPILQLLLP